MDLECALPDGAVLHRLGRTGLSLVDGFCTAEEAALVIETARPLLERSTVAEGDELEVHSDRSSSSALVHCEERPTPELEPLLARLAAFAALPVAHSEGLWALRYRPGERYAGHCDYYRPEVHADLMADWGNRLVTVLLYLGDVDDGGETEFARLGLRVRPRLGRAIRWLNVDADGGLHPETWHEARPLGSGEKWAVNAWFRERAVLDRPAGAFVRESAPAGLPLDESDEPLPEGVERLVPSASP